MAFKRRRFAVNKRTILGVPVVGFIGVVSALTLGIVIGSFCDFQISQALGNVTSLGTLFANYAFVLAYCLYPAGGALLYVGLKKKGESFRFLARVLLVLGWFMAVYYSNSYFGSKVRDLFGYVPGESSALISAASWLFWAVIYSWVPPMVVHLADDADPDRLIAVGAAILVAGFAGDCLNQWLKQVASRPRYKYLITLEDPPSAFRNWWQMIPYLAGNNDSFKSWPSGHMSMATMIFSLPMLTGALKNSSAKKNWIAFGIACVYVLAYMYNRIHMTNHFLTDTCWSALITYLTFALVSTAFCRTIEKK